MSLEDFVSRVKRKARADQFKLYEHKLPAIPPGYRQRYLLCLEACEDMVLAYKVLYHGRLLPERNFIRFLKFSSNRQPKEFYSAKSE